MHVVRKEVESVFDDMAEHNRVQIHAINLCEGQIEQIETEREKIQCGDLTSLRNQKDARKELSELQQIAERRKIKTYGNLHKRMSFQSAILIWFTAHTSMEGVALFVDLSVRKLCDMCSWNVQNTSTLETN